MMKIKKIITYSKLKNVKNFVAHFNDCVMYAYKKYHIPPQVILAQIALETGWGKKIVKGKYNGVGQVVISNNIFNIKVGSSWKGHFITKRALEYKKKLIPYFPKSAFRLYNNYSESVEDYCKLILTLSRYKKCRDNLGDPIKFIDGLIEGKYATDPRYKEKLLNIMSKYFVVDYELDYKISQANGKVTVSKTELISIKRLLQSSIDWIDEVIK